jgi:MFS family permease
MASVGVADGVSSSSSKAQQRMLASCFLGSTLEWYEFLIYGFLAPQIFDQLFFSTLNPLAGSIAVFGVFAVGFVARPFGGLFFGHLGDRIGRKPVLVITLCLVGFATTALGLLPTYAQVGVAAPLLLVTCRFLQGFALGGESIGAPLLAMESAPDRRRGVFSGLVQSGAPAGTVLGALAGIAVSQFPNDVVMAWAWRLPFLFSIVIFAVGFYIRSKVLESETFAKAPPMKSVPLLEVLKREKKPAAIVFGCAIPESAVFYFTAVFGLAYGMRVLKIDRDVLLTGVLLGNAIGIVAAPLFGGLTDRIGRRPLLAISFLTSIVYVAFLFFPLLSTGSTALIVLAMAIPPAILQPSTLGVTGTFYPEQFRDPRLRFSGVALGRQFGTVFGGGVAPLVATALTGPDGDLRNVLIYFVGLCLIGLTAVLMAPETRPDE